VTVEGGRIASVDRHFTDVMRWHRILVDAAGCDTPDDILSRIRAAVAASVDDADGRPLAVRIAMEGQCAAHAEVTRDPVWWRSEVRAAVIDASGGQAWTEKISVRTRSDVDFASIRERDDALGELMRTIAGQFGDSHVEDARLVGSGSFGKLVTGILAEVNQGVPLDVRSDESLTMLATGSGSEDLRREVEQMLFSRLRESLA
jgi:hypothetical protein